MLARLVSAGLLMVTSGLGFSYVWLSIVDGLRVAFGYGVTIVAFFVFWGCWLGLTFFGVLAALDIAERRVDSFRVGRYVSDSERSRIVEKELYKPKKAVER